MIKIRNIGKKTDNNWRIREISFSCKKGEVVGIVGNNGAGKTTLLKVLSGTLKKDIGEIEILNGNCIETMIGKIGSCITLDSGYKNMTAKENLEYIATLSGNINHKDIKKMLEELDINIPKKVEEFSLGMKVRLNLAMTLIKKPEVLILDEIFNGLDPSGQEKMKQIIVNYVKEDKIVLVSSHNLNDIEEISDKILIMKKGRIVYQFKKSDRENLRDVFEKYAN